MPLKVRQLALPVSEPQTALPAAVAARLGISEGQIESWWVWRRSLDARKKNRILWIYTLGVVVDSRLESQLLQRFAGDNEVSAAEGSTPLLQGVATSKPLRVVVVGMGPAGLLAAWYAAKCGAQVTLLEQGRPLEERVRDVRRFWEDGYLDFASNVAFGEGGAGTFSDGKLTTRLKHPWLRGILALLVSLGAPTEILTEAKPHVGTDRLRRVLRRLREQLQQMGVELCYNACLSGWQSHKGRLRAAVVNGHREYPCDALILACGNGARHTYRLLQRQQVAMSAKPFALGLRIEHPAELVAAWQYGPCKELLPPAEYALRWQNKAAGRGVYSFCMCPGGEVINSASEPGGLVVNGMSRYRRQGALSNSALVVTVDERDYGNNHTLAGMHLQQACERAAFRAGGQDYRAPAQNVQAFLQGSHGVLRSSLRPGVREAQLKAVLPDVVSKHLQQALPMFDRKLPGFASSEGTLVGVETRTSAPVRILRDEYGQSLSHAGLFPAGEGAGYAGGIMSSALDGLRAAWQVVTRMG